MKTFYCIQKSFEPRSLITVLGLLFLTTFCQAEETLEWCVDHIPLRHEFNGDELQGPTVEFMKSVAHRAGFTLTHTSDTPFQRCLKKMQHGSTDLMMGIVKSPERESYMHFIPVYKSRSESLFVIQNSAGAYQSKNDIRGLHLAKIKGYVMNTPDWPELAKNNHVQEINSVDDGLALLFHQHVDALISPHYSTLLRISHNPRFDNQITAADIKLNDSTERFVYLAFSKKAPISERLRKKTASVIANMVDNKEAELILFDSLKRLPND